MLHTFILVGRSGCGKGTQAALLRDMMHAADGKQILYVETGDRFRRFIQAEGYTSSEAREINDAGERQPDFLACWMWGNVLVDELHADMHIVFDGAPRAIAEAHVLTTALTFYKREKPVVIYLNVSKRWSEDRLIERARKDDSSIQKIEKKLKWFDESVIPALDYMKEDRHYTFVEVDGERSIEEVHQNILKELEIREIKI